MYLYVLNEHVKRNTLEEGVIKATLPVLLEKDRCSLDSGYKDCM